MTESYVQQLRVGYRELLAQFPVEEVVAIVHARLTKTGAAFFDLKALMLKPDEVKELAAELLAEADVTEPERRTPPPADPAGPSLGLMAMLMGWATFMEMTPEGEVLPAGEFERPTRMVPPSSVPASATRAREDDPEADRPTSRPPSQQPTKTDRPEVRPGAYSEVKTPRVRFNGKVVSK